jgi:DNA helicase II / ATP-dependent DNA helicase PcrA
MTYYGRKPSFSRSRSYTPKAAPVDVEFKAPTFKPSPYQQAIITALRETTDSYIVEAVAGSGKTSTLALIVALLLELGKSYVVVAFNKPIATELQSKGMNGRTFHSMGYAAVNTACMARNNGVRPTLEAAKVSQIVADMYGTDSVTYAGALVRLVGLAKNHMMRPNVTDEEIISLMSHFDVEWDDDSITDDIMCDMVRETLAANNHDTRTIDFDDQLYFCWLFDLSLPKYDYILVDESQDTNPLRRNLVARMMKPTSRVVAVGDARQAIYGFTGASHDSLDLIARDFKCKRLPLSVSYRCPRSVVALAKTIVPQIEARDDAPDGQVLRPATFKRSDFLPTDLLVCRNTAPLVQVAYKLLAARIPCRIMGREIGKSLTSLIKKLSRKNETLESLLDRLAEYRDREVTIAMKQRKESKAQSIQDKCDAISAIIESMTPEDADGGIMRLITIIDGMFADTKNGCITLATVHKSKGLEALRVFIIDAHLMPSKMARQEWQIVQERNLMYVAYTRALETLVFVKSEHLTD